MVGKGPGLVKVKSGGVSSKGKKFGSRMGKMPSFGFGNRMKQGMKSQPVKYGSA